MKRIDKYPLEVTDRQAVVMPRGSRILTVQLHGGVPTLWAVVDPSAEPQARTIEIVATGGELSEEIGFDRKYIGTFQLPDGDYAGHVYLIL